MARRRQAARKYPSVRLKNGVPSMVIFSTGGAARRCTGEVRVAISAVSRMISSSSSVPASGFQYRTHVVWKKDKLGLGYCATVKRRFCRIVLQRAIDYRVGRKAISGWLSLRAEFRHTSHRVGAIRCAIAPYDTHEVCRAE
jgi:hypothetical protein